MKKFSLKKRNFQKFNNDYHKNPRSAGFLTGKAGFLVWKGISFSIYSFLTNMLG